MGSRCWFNPEIHHRHSIRLKGYDYSSAGSYFLTLCTHRKACSFGHIVNAQMHLSPAGQMIKTAWEEIPCFYANYEIGPFQVMPNHLHGVIRIIGEPCVNSQAKGRGQGPAPTVGNIVGRFKSLTAKQLRDDPALRFGLADGKLWQRSFYEHIIRSEDEYYEIRRYILTNPANWDTDELRPS